MLLQRDPDKLEVYSETKHSKAIVGLLRYDRETKIYIFEYDRKYLQSKSAIPIGPELSLRKRVHQTKGSLFPSLNDRIPSRRNPAYAEYCRSQGIDPSEANPIILLGTIGKRGPSTFVFESLYLDNNVKDRFKHFRQSVNLSIRELAAAFDLNYLTLHRIEKGKSKDRNTLTLLEIYLNFPSAALWVITKNERKLHQATAQTLISLFVSKLRRESTELPLLAEGRKQSRK